MAATREIKLGVLIRADSVIKAEALREAARDLVPTTSAEQDDFYGWLMRRADRIERGDD
jgi:hypothetical protein